MWSRGHKARGQGQGFDLRGQGQGLQNVSSRPRTSSRTPPLIKTLNFTWVVHLNWLAKIKLRGPGPPRSLLLIITVVLEDAKRN